MKKEIEKIKAKKEETQEAVLEFLKEHEGKGFTADELVNRLDVEQKYIKYQMSPLNPFVNWKINTERDGRATYYYAERVNTKFKWFVLGWIGMVVALILGVVI